MLEIQTVSKGAELISAKLNGIEKIHDGKNFWKNSFIFIYWCFFL